MIRLFLFFLCLSVLAPTHAAEAGQWETLQNCRLLKKETYDGDSFHVRHDGKEYIFRLLYVDTPEKKELGLTERTTEQARYWKIYKKDLYLLAEEALVFTGQKLSAPFTIQTRWEDAKGNSQLPRYYAIVTTSDNQDLASLLLENGLARIHGRPVEAPDGRAGKKVLEDLEKIEVLAKTQKRGAWAFPSRGTKK